jgi:hypothetical protein
MLTSLHIPTLHVDATQVTSAAMPCLVGADVKRTTGNAHALAARYAR